MAQPPPLRHASFADRSDFRQGHSAHPRPAIDLRRRTQGLGGGTAQDREATLAITDSARREPRDLYDLWYISNEGHIPHREDLIDGLNRKLASREGRADDVLVPRLEAMRGQVEKTLKQRWNDRLRMQVMSLPEFDGCYREVKRLLSDFDKLRESPRR